MLSYLMISEVDFMLLFRYKTDSETPIVAFQIFLLWFVRIIDETLFTCNFNHRWNFF